MARESHAIDLEGPAFSLIVSTLGRSDELKQLFKSLAGQICRDFEVIVVDQNDDDRVERAIGSADWGFPFKIVRRPGERGLSRGRNVGWRVARGRIFGFPDDDCWYPPNLLEKVKEAFEVDNVDVLCGRAADETGRSINGRFETVAQTISRWNVWTTQIEWMVFFHRAALEAVDGYDETIGVGSSTPWQAAEGQDVILRVLARGLKCRYDPTLIGHHAELRTDDPDRALELKGRKYARGMGFVLRKHGFGPHVAVYWALRSAVNLLKAVMVVHPGRIRYYANVSVGRLEGWCRFTLPLPG